MASFYIIYIHIIFIKRTSCKFYDITLKFNAKNAVVSFYYISTDNTNTFVVVDAQLLCCISNTKTKEIILHLD